VVDGVTARDRGEPRPQRRGLFRSPDLAERRHPDRLKDAECRLVVTDDRTRKIQ
jgi:hypothetical protein